MSTLHYCETRERAKDRLSVTRRSWPAAVWRGEVSIEKAMKQAAAALTLPRKGAQRGDGHCNTEIHGREASHLTEETHGTPAKAPDDPGAISLWEEEAG